MPEPSFWGSGGQRGVLQSADATTNCMDGETVPSSKELMLSASSARNSNHDMITGVERSQRKRLGAVKVDPGHLAEANVVDGSLLEEATVLTGTSVDEMKERPDSVHTLSTTVQVELEPCNRLPLTLRWGIGPRDLRQVWKLHECSFPIAYDLRYYRWLLQETCISIVAITTVEALDAAKAATQFTGGVRDPSSVSLAAFSSESHMAVEREEVEQWVKSQEQASVAVDDKGTVVVGFVIGQIGYALHAVDGLLPYPTGYVGSVAVHPHLRRRGIGAVMLREYLDYMTSRLPLRATAFLRYSRPRKALQEAQTKPGTTLSAVATDAAHHQPQLGDDRGTAMRWLCLFMPHVEAWANDRDARRQLAAQGLTPEQIEKARRRPPLPPSWPDATGHTDCEDDCNDDSEGGVPVVQHGVPEVYLHCLSEDSTLIKLYLKLGFMCMRVLEDFYSFGGRQHDAMMLVYVRPYEGKVCHSILQAPSCSGEEHKKDQPVDGQAVTTFQDDPKPLPRWYGRVTETQRRRVTDISLDSVEQSRARWHREQRQLRGAVQSPSSFSKTDLGFLFNAVALLGVVCWYVYNYGLTGNEPKR